MSTDPILLKPSATIQLSNPFNFGERMLLNTLMYHAQVDEVVTASEHDMPLEDVFDSVGWEDSKNVSDLQDYCRTLLSTVVEWNEFGKDRRKAWKACQFLSSFEIKGGRLRYRINPTIVAEIKRPELYGKIHMLVQTQLKKKHSQVLYEYFQDEIGRGSGDAVILENVPIADITLLLGLSDSEYYNQYKYLNGEILKPCLKEINKYSDVNVVHSAVKKGRSTVGITFTLMRLESYQMAFDLKGTSTESKPEVLEDKLQSLLESHGMTDKVAVRLVKKYSAPRIKSNVDHMLAEIGRGKSIKNRGAWLRKAIEEDWQPVKSAAEIEASKKLQEDAAARIIKKQNEMRREDLEEEFKTYRSETVRTKFEAKSKAFQTRRRNDFIKRMQEENNTVLLGMYAKNGWDAAGVDAVFFSGLYEELLTDEHEQSVEAFAMWQKTAAA